MRSATSIAVVLMLLAGCGGSAAADRPTNVILISIDTLRPDHLSCYGYERPTSPAIDRVAAQGTRFTDVTSASPWTLPSHASLFTGLYPSHHGVKDHVHRLPAELPTLATILAGRGMQTMAIVNSHNLSKRYGLAQGVQRYSYVTEWADEKATSGPTANRGDEITALAMQWLEERDDAPFFLFLHYYDVHTDFTADERYQAMFRRPYDGPLDGSTAQLVQARRAKAKLSPADVRFLHDMYDAEIRQLDDVLAGLFEELDASGLSDETLVVITSDHGEEFMEHGSMLHGRTHYQEVIGIPLIVRGPGVPVGVVDHPVSLVDVAPTILSMLGVTDGPPVDGIDLTAMIRAPGERPASRFLYAEADHNNAALDIKRSVRMDRLKLSYDRMVGRSELFDLESDPGELTDLSDERADARDVLFGQIEEFMRSERSADSIEPPSEDALEKLRQLGYVR